MSCFDDSGSFFVFVVFVVLFFVFIQRHNALAWTLEPRPTCFFLVFLVDGGFVDDVGVDTGVVMNSHFFAVD